MARDPKESKEAPTAFTTASSSSTVAEILLRSDSAKIHILRILEERHPCT